VDTAQLMVDDRLDCNSTQAIVEEGEIVENNEIAIVEDQMRLWK
jgi:hypothetical protein